MSDRDRENGSNLSLILSKFSLFCSEYSLF